MCQYNFRGHREMKLKQYLDVLNVWLHGIVCISLNSRLRTFTFDVKMLSAAVKLVSCKRLSEL